MSSRNRAIGIPPQAKSLKCKLQLIMLVDDMQVNNALADRHITQLAVSGSASDNPFSAEDHNPFRGAAQRTQQPTSPRKPVTLDQFYQLLLGESSQARDTASFQPTSLRRVPSFSNLEEAKEKGDKFLKALKNPHANPLDKNKLSAQHQDRAQNDEQPRTPERRSAKYDTDASRYAAHVRASMSAGRPVAQPTHSAASQASQPAKQSPESKPTQAHRSSINEIWDDDLNQSILQAKAWLESQFKDVDPAASDAHSQKQLQLKQGITKATHTQTELINDHGLPSSIKPFAHNITGSSEAIDQQSQFASKPNILKRVKSFLKKKNKTESANANIETGIHRPTRQDTTNTDSTGRTRRSFASIAASVRSFSSRVSRRFRKTRHHPVGA
ncbi:hypothetical protein SAMN04487769_2922 [Burkholderia sp. b14]|nr:hypothetical protein SAMN04487768_1725 [Burkholderia sp. b13]SIT78045.1 hypothetical protein SAMN04487769_2922 [Burkholderia sp. b14]